MEDVISVDSEVLEVDVTVFSEVKQSNQMLTSLEICVYPNKGSLHIHYGQQYSSK